MSGEFELLLPGLTGIILKSDAPGSAFSIRSAQGQAVRGKSESRVRERTSASRRERLTARCGYVIIIFVPVIPDP